MKPEPYSCKAFKTQESHKLSADLADHSVETHSSHAKEEAEKINLSEVNENKTGSSHIIPFLNLIN
jgi:hypothetical protein